MTRIITATYEGGVLKPVGPLPLVDGQTVEVTVTVVPADAAHRAAAVQALEEAFAANDGADDTPAGYDFFAAMNANRSPGKRLPYPPETKGTAW